MLWTLLWRLLPTLIIFAWLSFQAIAWYRRHQARRKLEQEGRLKPRPQPMAIPTAIAMMAAVASLLVLLTFYRESVMAVGLVLLAMTALAIAHYVRGDAAISQARRWMAAGNTRAAVQCLDDAIAESPSAKRLAVLADCHGVRGDHRRAAECYRKAQDMDHGRLDYAARQVLHLQLDGQWEAAADALALWRQKHPEQMTFALLACRQHLKMGQTEFACEQLRQALELAQVASGEQRSHITGLLQECAEALHDDMRPRAFEVRTTPPPAPPPPPPPLPH